tara:strand:- start:96 stop:644 length:549 start_codon:yes stop_codon:yes gene_type:complete
MSFISMGAIALYTVGASTAYGAYKGGQQEKAADAATAAAGQIKKEQMQLQTRQKELKDKQNLIAYEGKVGDITMQSTSAVGNLMAQGQEAELKTGLETSSVQKKLTTGKSDIAAAAQSSLQKLVATRKLAAESSQFDFESGEMGAKREEASILAGIDPGGAMAGATEGFFNSLGTGALIATS